LATLPNWIREFEKWLPSVPVCRFHGSAQDRDAMLEGPLNKSKRKNADYPIIVTSYEVAIRDEKRLNKIGEYTFLVVDEGQRLKNHRCTLISSLKRIRASNRLLLSGTPIQVREEFIVDVAILILRLSIHPSCSQHVPCFFIIFFVLISVLEQFR
jgi:ATP-dependent DNA helicase